MTQGGLYTLGTSTTLASNKHHARDALGGNSAHAQCGACLTQRGESVRMDNDLEAHASPDSTDQGPYEAPEPSADVVLQERAALHAQQYMRSAVEALESVRDIVSAQDYPALIAAFMRTCAQQYTADRTARAIEYAGEYIGNSVGSAIENAQPYFNDDAALHHLSQTLEEAAREFTRMVEHLASSIRGDEDRQ